MEVKIELNRKVAREFITDEYQGELLDFNLYLPEFNLTFPELARHTDDELEDIVNAYMAQHTINTEDYSQKMIAKMQNSIRKGNLEEYIKEATLEVQVREDRIESFLLLADEVHLVGRILLGEDSSWAIDNEAPSPITPGLLTNLLNNSVHYLMKPRTVKEITTTMRKERKKGKKGKKTKQMKRYVYKNITIKEIAEEKDSKNREYIRETPAWRVRGHWRTYTDEAGNIKKRIWIKPQVRYAEVDLDPQMEEITKPYRITRVD